MTSTHCNYFVQRKKRFCRMTVRTGDKYCGEHKPITETSKDDDNSDSNRIVCPLDNTHTCYKSKLQKHLKKCNAKEKEFVPYIQKSINGATSTNTEKRSLFLYSEDEINKVVTKIEEIYDKHIRNNITPMETSVELLKEEIENPKYGNTTKKHLIQTSALIGILYEYNLVLPETCFVEFGAGKGKLSFWLAKSIENVPNSSVLLVERASLRHKLDNKLEKDKHIISRVRADIADLVLKNVEIVDKSKRIVGITKHLCGEATDLALKCLMKAKEEKYILGALMSFCCHHRCRWENYVGKKFFELIGLSKQEFDIMCGLVSWAVCGTGMSRERRNCDFNEVETNTNKKIKFSISEREEIGRKCKHIIDWGRKTYLEEMSFKSILHFYVKSDVTLENVCLVAINRDLN